MTDGKTVKVGLGLYILNDKGQVLLGLRKAKHGEGTWCPPGGHMEYGESFEEGAVREAFEETGIRVNPADVRVAGVTNDFFRESGKHYVTINLTTRSFAGEPESPNRTNAPDGNGSTLTSCRKTCFCRQPIF